PQPPAEPLQFPGAGFNWNLGSPYMTYPFAIYDPGSHFMPGYDLIFVEPLNSTTCVCSPHCTGMSPSKSDPCLTCQNTSALVVAVKEHTMKPMARLNHNTMSNDQLREKLKLMEQNLKDLTFKVLVHTWRTCLRVLSDFLCIVS
ncbi:hypothetical protein L208DRAFT_1274800, partial [Tricholoma matsutake]